MTKAAHVGVGGLDRVPSVGERYWTKNWPIRRNGQELWIEG